jgi:hypothetical protein
MIDDDVARAAEEDSASHLVQMVFVVVRRTVEVEMEISRLVVEPVV